MHRLTMARTLVTKFAGLPRNPAITRGTILTKKRSAFDNRSLIWGANLTEVPLDDFNLLLGIYFMRILKAAPIPHLDGLIFMGEKDPRFVKGIKTFVVGSKKTAGLVA
ncbi:hypothetical protein KY289_030321 [Solanum tuberosum]|nr:hypothetical protein KY289_030321 [Solanum tuberosum]